MPCTQEELQCTVSEGIKETILSLQYGSAGCNFKRTETLAKTALAYWWINQITECEIPENIRCAIEEFCTQAPLNYITCLSAAVSCPATLTIICTGLMAVDVTPDTCANPNISINIL